MLVFASGDFQMNREELNRLLSFFSFSNPAPIPSIIKPKLKSCILFYLLPKVEKNMMKIPTENFQPE